MPHPSPTAPARQRRLQALLDQVVMPVIRAPQPEQALAVAKALHDGGLTVLEVAWNCAGAREVLQEIRRWPGVAVGVGTVCDAATAADVLALGADFLVSPILLPDLVPVAHEAGAPCVLAAATPTEVWQAHQAGSDLIKLFPVASLGGPGLIKNLREPFGDLPWLVSGGVDFANAGTYLDLGARVLALGGSLLPKAAVAAGDWAQIRANAVRWRQWLQTR